VLTLLCCVVLAGMHLWHAKYHHHMRRAQAHFCTRLIVVPLTTFHRLAELIGDPQGELIFLFNTARCGSTLLTQVKGRLRLLRTIRSKRTVLLFSRGQFLRH